MPAPLTTLTLLGAIVGALSLTACGDDSSGPDEPQPLEAPVEGLWGSEEVALTYGFGTSVEGLERIWSSGISATDTPFAVVLSTAEVSCDTELGAGNPPKGYSLVLLFEADLVGARSNDLQVHSNADGWISSGGAGGSMVVGMLSAVDDTAVGGSMDVDDGQVFMGTFEVPRCPEL